jgi:hypothetical protein
MKREIQHIIDDHVNLSDHRELISESKALIDQDSNIIIQLLDKLYETELEQEYKRNQLRDKFLSYLFHLNEEDMISLSFKIVKKFNSKLNIKELADKIVFFSSENNVLNQIIRSINDKELKNYNHLLLGELVLRGKLPDVKFKDEFLTGDIKWVGLKLSSIEQDLTLRSYTKNGGGFGFNFGIQNEPKLKYKFNGYENLVLKSTSDDNIIKLSSGIARDYISILEIGNISFIDESIDDIKSEIIAHLNYQETQSSEIEIAFRHIDNKDVYQYLFGMSVFGGAFERCEFHATSRINAWKVIGGLMQKDYKDYPKEVLERSLDEFQWTEFSCNNEWFINEWLDLGIIGMSLDNKKYAILAITDTD